MSQKTDFFAIHFFAEQLIREAGARIKNQLTNQLTIDTKKNAHDFVTNIDKETEFFLVKQIKKQYPDHKIISEEGYGDTLTDLKGIVWGIDPIDGTSNLVYKQKDFAISVSVYQDGVGELAYIYDVVADLFYHAKRGQGAFENYRRLPKRADRKLVDSLVYSRFNYIYTDEYHIREVIQASRGLGGMSCASLGLVELGKGTVDVMINKGAMKFWDISAGKLFAEENGVVFQGVDGSSYKICEDKTIIAGGPDLIREITARFWQL
ncbi:inositol monophosphatase family protein [Enterococcus sp. LJL99]